MDLAGNVASNRTEEAHIIKGYLADRGRADFVSFEQMLQDFRARKRAPPTFQLCADAVVGIVDTRNKIAKAPAGKAFGPGLVPPDLFRVAPEQISRLLDPIGVEATLSRDVPLQWQGGDVHMLVKSWASSPQSLLNRREI